MRTLLAVFLLLLLLPGARADAPLPAQLDAVLNDPALRGGIVSAWVQKVGEQEPLYTRNPDVRLLPASNRKLFTAAAALNALGPDFRWTTRALSDEKPDANGTLDGNLYLAGSGDASLTTADLDKLAADVAAAGIKRIDGAIWGDGSLFSDSPYGFGWEWDDFSDEEFAPIAALTVNDGDIAVTVTAGKAAGSPVIVSLAPAMEPPPANAHNRVYPPVVSHARTAAANALATLTIHRAYDADAITIAGDIPAGQTVTKNVPARDGPRYAAAVFAQCLQAHGVVVTGPLDSGPALPAPTVTLATHVSAPLSQWLALMLKPSDNLMAESLVRTLGAVKGAGGTYNAGHAAELPFFQSLGIDTTQITLVDGCGVGRRNFVTARAVAQLLLGMSRRPDWPVFRDALPVMGVDGTLKKRGRGTAMQGDARAKTGSLGSVSCLSGVVTGRTGNVYVYSLLMNNFVGPADAARAVQDKAVLLLAQSP